jgi:hypothetical protein
MTGQTESKSPSRRALLAGALGGLGAWVASTVGGKAPVSAANGDPLIVGSSLNQAAGFTRLAVTSPSQNNAFECQTQGIGIGVYGLNYTANGASLEGVRGWSDDGTGVHGQSYHGVGVLGDSLFSDGGVGVRGEASAGSASKGVVGRSTAGHGIHGSSDTGWAGFFDGRIFGNSYVELAERSNPGIPANNRARLYVRDNGSGHTQLVVKFHNGEVRVLATA